MYKLKYVRSDGKAINMTPDSDYLIATVSGVTGHGVTINASQGYNQIGSTFESTSVGSVTLNINGYISGEKRAAKMALLAMFAPQTHGRLYLDGEYWIDVYVKRSPTITQDVYSSFNLALYAPYPYWRSVGMITQTMGVTTKKFRFPVNYATAHKFGESNMSGAVNCYNAGSAPALFGARIKFAAETVNPVITNVHTGKFLRLNGTFQDGEVINISRDGSLVIVEKTSEGETVNALDVLDDSSDLFQLEIGDNVLQTSADLNGEVMEITLQYYESWAGVMCSAV